MLYSRTDPDSYITERTFVFEEYTRRVKRMRCAGSITVFWEGDQESRKCSGYTYPVSNITKNTYIRRCNELDLVVGKNASQGARGLPQGLIA